MGIAAGGTSEVVRRGPLLVFGGTLEPLLESVALLTTEVEDDHRFSCQPIAKAVTNKYINYSRGKRGAMTNPIIAESDLQTREAEHPKGMQHLLDRIKDWPSDVSAVLVLNRDGSVAIVGDVPPQKPTEVDDVLSISAVTGSMNKEEMRDQQLLEVIAALCDEAIASVSHARSDINALLSKVGRA